MRKLFVCFVVVALALVSTSAEATIIANAGGDWVASDGSTAGSVVGGTGAGWSYFRSTAANGGTENALTTYAQTGDAGGPGFGAGVAQNGGGRILPVVQGDNADGGDYELFGDGDLNGGVVGTDLLIHPDTVTADSAFVLVRYTVSAADILNGTSATIAGSFRNLPGGSNSVSVFVYHNNSQLFTVDGNSGGGSDGDTTILSQVDGTFNVNAVVGVGDTIDFVVGHNGDRGGDESALRATVDLVPEPNTALLALIGCLGTMLIRRRRR